MATREPVTPMVTAAALASVVTGSRSADIERALRDLIVRDGASPGAQLPTVRAVAAELGVSIGSVSNAWAALAREGLIVTRRRGGSHVAAATTTTAGNGSARAADVVADLGSAVADPALLPDRERAVLAAAQPAPAAHQPAVMPELRRAVLRRWPYSPPGVIAVPSVRAALQSIAAVLLRPADPIASVDPLCLRTADVLRRLPNPTIAVELDEEGPVVDSLADAVRAGATLFCFQPSLSVPTGVSTSPRRLRALAELLAGHPHVRAFEEDTAAGLLPGSTLGTAIPAQVLRAAPYSRAYGADLTVALLSGPTDDIAALARKHSLDGVTVSVLTQRVLSNLLVDRRAANASWLAAQTYLRRNRALLDALDDVGVAATGDGFFVWVAVADETAALDVLAEHGVRASAGSRSTLSGIAPGRLRIATTLLPDHPAELTRMAALIASAATATATATAGGAPLA